MKRKSINRVNAHVRGFVHEYAGLKLIHVNALAFLTVQSHLIPRSTLIFVTSSSVEP